MSVDYLAQELRLLFQRPLREAIANALVRRDYSKYTENAYIKISVFADRIEIVNPGALYGCNRLESLGIDKPMDSRNPNLVRLLEEKNPQLGDKPILEKRHSGILTMRIEIWLTRARVRKRTR